MRIGVLICAGIGLVACQSIAVPSDVIDGIRKSEDAYVNIQIDGTSETEVFNGQTSSWEFRGRAEVVALYDGAPGGKVKIDFKKLIGVWVDGPSPYIEQIAVVAFNGKISEKLVTQEAMRQEKGMRPHGEISGSRSDVIDDIGNFASGWHFALPGILDESNSSLSRLLLSADPSVEATETEFKGAKCLRVCLTFPTRTRSWILDPAKGYAVLSAEETSGTEVLSKVTVEKMTEPVPNVFYPEAILKEDFVNGVAT